MVEFNETQTGLVKQYISGFKEFRQTEKAKSWQLDREERVVLYRKLLDPQHLKNLTEEEFGTIWKKLWASQVWGNKDYRVNEILEANGIDRIRQELSILLYGDRPLEVRFDRFRENITGLGHSSISEILVFANPNEFCLWNRKPIHVLPFLKCDNLLPKRVFKYALHGEDYVKCNEVLGLIRDQLRMKGLSNADYVDVDFFLAYLFYEIVEKQEQPAKVEPISKEQPHINPKSLTHWDAIGLLVRLGNALGFDTYVADPKRESNGQRLGELSSLDRAPEEFQGIKEIERVDVIWFSKVFPPSYFFEVEDGGNMRDALQRLFQASHFNVKFFVVSPSDNKGKFERWASTAPYKHVNYNFKSYEELVGFFEGVTVFNKLRNEFLGIR